MCANKHSYPTNVTQLTEKTATHSKRRGYSVVESPQRMVSEPILQSVPELDDNTFPLEEIITPTEVDAPILQTFKLEDLKKQTKTKDKVGVMTSVWNLINDIMTPATISIAFYVAQCGLVLSLILLCIFSLITVYTLCILYDLSKAHKRKSLPDLCSYAFGRPGYYIASLCIFTFNFGGCLISTLMLGELVPALLRDQLGVDHFLFGRTAVMCYLTAVMLPITMRKKLSGFAFTSFISVGTLAVIGVLIMYRAVIDRGEIPEPKEPLVWFSRNAVLALGGLSYTFVCHDLSFSVFEELKSATKKRYYSVVYITIGLTIIFLFLIGVGGYTLFGERALETTTVLSLFPNHDVLGTVCKLFFIIDLFFSIPFQLFMPRLGLKFMAVSMYPQLRTDKQKSNTFFYASTIFVTVLSLIISIAVEDLGAVFEICGGVSACALAYIIPPLIALKVSNLSNANKFFCVTILFIGTTILLCSLVASIKRLVL